MGTKAIINSITIYAAAGVLVLLQLLIPCQGFSMGKTTRVSVSSAGVQGDDDSDSPSISADGRYVAFDSYATLVDEDTNGASDVFVHDRQNGETRRVSVTSTGSQVYNSYSPSISSDGRYVAFHSWGDIVDGDFGGSDIFVHDCHSVETTLVSVSSEGVPGNEASYNPSISADGRYVVFQSYADNLVDGDTNGEVDIFVHDRQSGETKRVSVSSEGVQGNSISSYQSISADGRYVAFSSRADNLVDGDTNDDPDIFVHDRQSGQTTRVSVTSTGVELQIGSFSPKISPDGQYVAFESRANTLVDGDTNRAVDVFVHDRKSLQITRVSVNSAGVEGDDNSTNPSISSKGRYIIFVSDADNLVVSDTNGRSDVFVHDRQSGETTRVSVSSEGVQGNGDSSEHSGLSISADGRFVAFESIADNLVAGDTNDAGDVFVNDRFYVSPGHGLPSIPLLLLGD